MNTTRILLFLLLTAGIGRTQAQDNPAPAPAAEPAPTEMQKWIATTDAQWQAMFKRDVTDVHETELNKVKLQYLTSLETGIAKASAASDLNGALALRNERKRFDDTNVFPEEDEAGDTASVKAIRAAIRAQLAKLEKDSAARAKALHAKYDVMLAQAQAQLTQRQRLDDAVLVQNKRGEVAAAWLAGVPATPAPAAPPPLIARPKGKTPDPILSSFDQLLRSATWEWFEGRASDVPLGEVRFLEDGTLETTIHYLSGWKRMTGNKIRVNNVAGPHWVFLYSSSGRQAVTINEKGSLGENKMLKVKKQQAP